MAACTLYIFIDYLIICTCFVIFNDLIHFKISLSVIGEFKISSLSSIEIPILLSQESSSISGCLLRSLKKGIKSIKFNIVVNLFVINTIYYLPVFLGDFILQIS